MGRDADTNADAVELARLACHIALRVPEPRGFARAGEFPEFSISTSVVIQASDARATTVMGNPAANFFGDNTGTESSVTVTLSSSLTSGIAWTLKNVATAPFSWVAWPDISTGVSSSKP